MARYLEIMDPDTGLAAITRDCGHVEMVTALFHEEELDGHLVGYVNPDEDHVCMICWEECYPQHVVAGIKFYMATCMLCMRYIMDTPVLPTTDYRCEGCKDDG